ncbi:TPA: mersacidin family lantibiotic [Bacillus toyonensis]|jgi:hypothetical protein|uniref:mersacidin family lantibiotic n=1 Tax=Bacillus toyonensis TaxID=155322 RepID=UPI00240DD02E|nr:mersacidin family lantibiotic [Bacillus toyonensis]MDG1564805.1 mersacidin family lantibiotic [Bacillus toyonensis]HDR7345115.1 mersacidin family lantibiotic [Bacillus toyonensis]HDR7506738.1 mersacidin family lantibiotic [Bacillus toyonensis]
MNREQVIKKVNLSNPAGSSMPEMTVEELTRIHGGGDVQGETTPTAASSMMCVGVGVRMSSKNCAAVGGAIVGSILSNYKC